MAEDRPGVGRVLRHHPPEVGVRRRALAGGQVQEAPVHPQRGVVGPTRDRAVAILRTLRPPTTSRGRGAEPGKAGGIVRVRLSDLRIAFRRLLHLPLGRPDVPGDATLPSGGITGRGDLRVAGLHRASALAGVERGGGLQLAIKVEVAGLALEQALSGAVDPLTLAHQGRSALQAVGGGAHDQHRGVEAALVGGLQGVDRQVAGFCHAGTDQPEPALRQHRWAGGRRLGVPVGLESVARDEPAPCGQRQQAGGCEDDQLRLAGPAFGDDPYSPVPMRILERPPELCPRKLRAGRAGWHLMQNRIADRQNCRSRQCSDGGI